jgi:hypothetical protein
VKIFEENKRRSLLNSRWNEPQFFRPPLSFFIPNRCHRRRDFLTIRTLVILIAICFSANAWAFPAAKLCPAPEKTYMASVSWQYPEDQLIALRRQNASAEAATPIVTGVDISRLRFRYAIEGDNPPWRPVSAFDDGSKVYIEMPSGIAQGEAPPLFVIGPEGDGQLVNYRVRQNYYIVDRLFAAAELRMGGEQQQTVRISRTDGRMR